MSDCWTAAQRERTRGKNTNRNRERERWSDRHRGMSKVTSRYAGTPQKLYINKRPRFLLLKLTCTDARR